MSKKYRVKFLDLNTTYHDSDKEDHVGIHPSSHVLALSQNRERALKGEIPVTLNHSNDRIGSVLSIDLDENGIPVAIIEVEKDVDVKGISPGLKTNDVQDGLIMDYDLDHITIVNSDDIQSRKPFESGDMILLGADIMVEEEKKKKVILNPKDDPDIAKELMKKLKHTEIEKEKQEKELELKLKKLEDMETKLANSMEKIKQYEDEQRTKLINELSDSAKNIMVEGGIDINVVDMAILEQAVKLSNINKPTTTDKVKEEVLDAGVPPPERNTSTPEKEQMTKLQEISMASKYKSGWKYFTEEQVKLAKEALEKHKDLFKKYY